MLYKLMFSQSGGDRQYDLAQLNIPDITDMPNMDRLDQELASVLEKVCKSTVYHTKRAIGWSYFASFIKEDSIGLEIGVDMGDGLARILERKPRIIYAIDPWVAWDDEWSDSQNMMDARFKFVCNKYSANESVVILRETSDEFFRTNGPQLDWAYIDGDHSYEQCLRDIINSYDSLLSGGVIAIDDKNQPGVNRAINEFLPMRDDSVLVWSKTDPVIIGKK